jgi:hypothetical protein
MKERNRIRRKRTLSIFLMLMMLTGMLAIMPQTLAVAPTVTTNDATGVEETNATLRGTLTNDGGEVCTVRFEYGLTTIYGTNTTNQTKTIGQTFTKNISTKTLCDYYNTGDVSHHAFFNNTYFAQTFNASTSYDITTVRVKLRRFGNPGTIYACLRATNITGFPTGANLTIGSTNGDTLPSSSFEWRNITFTNSYPLSTGTTYAIILTAPSAVSPTSEVAWREDIIPGYPNGSGYTSTNNGSTWINNGVDRMFETYLGTTTLTPGTLYHYRSYANNTGGSSTGADKTFLTKPNEPTGLLITRAGAGFTLAWTKGSGANNTRIQGKIGSYPTSYTDGTLIYNGTATTANHISLTAGNTWYYRAWSYSTWSGLQQYSDDYNQGNKLFLTNPSITTNTTTGVLTTNATLWGYIQNNGGEICTVRFQYGLTTGYGTTTTNQTKTTGQTFSINISSLTPGTPYHYRAMGNNTNGTSYGTDRMLLTRPEPPVSATPTLSGTTITLTWTIGTGANTTRVERNTVATWSIGAGTLLYNGTGTTYADTTYPYDPATGDIDVYYQYWSYTTWGTQNQYSASDTEHYQKKATTTVYVVKVILPLVIGVILFAVLISMLMMGTLSMKFLIGWLVLAVITIVILNVIFNL